MACDPVETSRTLDPEPSLALAARSDVAFPRWIGLVPYEARRTLERRSRELRPEPSLVSPLWRRYDAVVDTISAKHDLTSAINALKPGGTLALLGAAAEPLQFSPLPLLFGGKKIVGSLVGNIADTQVMLDHCGRHGIVSDIELITPDQINEAYERVQ